MRNLCDSNVLVAAVAQHHSHHVKAARWMNELGDEDSVALCRATQLTFLRLLTTESVMKGGVQTNRNALAVLHVMMGDPRFVFVREEPQDIEGWAAWADLRTASPKVWMDAYLAAMAKGLSCRLVTFDRGFERFRSGGLDVLVL